MLVQISNKRTILYWILFRLKCQYPLCSGAYGGMLYFGISDQRTGRSDKCGGASRIALLIFAHRPPFEALMLRVLFGRARI